MQWARRSILVIATVAAATGLGLGSVQAAPASGTWSANVTVLTLDENGGRLEFGCGFATLASPVIPDRRGRFKTIGAYFPEPERLVDADKPAARIPARIEGTFKGEKLHLTFKPDGGQAETFDLVAGRRHKLIRCL